MNTYEQASTFVDIYEKHIEPVFNPTTIGELCLLRKYLIEQQIYCPVHWPISNLHQISERAKEIYHIELSLVCDQRYGKSDMDRMAKALNNFF